MKVQDERVPNPENEDKNEFLTDTQKIVQLHLSDENHVITEEEMKSIRIGVEPPLREETEEVDESTENKAADHKADAEDDLVPGAQKTTPWDVLDA